MLIPICSLETGFQFPVTESVRVIIELSKGHLSYNLVKIKNYCSQINGVISLNLALVSEES